MIEREGFDREITFYCDACSADEETGCTDFDDARACIKRKGWVIKKVGDEWCHFCGQECANPRSLAGFTQV
jgi:hypothetical protein